jgi:hypothetical protein
MKMVWKIKALKERAIPKAPCYYVGDIETSTNFFVNAVGICILLGKTLNVNCE